MSIERKDQQGDKGFGPVWGCVLIGGASKRMGTPKHLLVKDGVTWLELILSKLMQKTEQVVISGKGSVPDILHEIPIVEDVAGIQGPIAGILSILREYPGVSWLVAACDMPDIELAALDWLLEQRTVDSRAILPDLNGDGMVEPLLAYYDSNCLNIIEKIVHEGSCRPGGLVGEPGVRTPLVPQYLHSSWKNVNFPEKSNS